MYSFKYNYLFDIIKNMSIITILHKKLYVSMKCLLTTSMKYLCANTISLETLNKMEK